MNDNNINNSGNNNTPQQPVTNNINPASTQNDIEQTTSNLQDMFQSGPTQQNDNNINTTQNVNEQQINNNTNETTQNNIEQPVNNINQTQEQNVQHQQQQPINNNQNKKKSPKMILIILFVIVAIIIAIFVAKKFIFKTASKDKRISSLFSEDTPIRVVKDKKYGYIDQKGNFVIEPKYDYATEFVGDFAEVAGKTKIEDNEVNLYQIIDKKGNVKATAKYSGDIKYIDEYDIWIIEDKLYDGTLKKISPDNIDVDYQDGEYLRWTDDSAKKGGIMKTNGKITYTYSFQEKESYIGIDSDDIDETLKEKYCRITIENEKYAIVNCDTGKVVYDYTENFIIPEGDNIFKVSKKDDYGFISIMYIQNDKIMYESSSNNVELYYYGDGGYIEIRDADKDYEERYSYIDVSTGKKTKERPTSENSETNLDEWEKYTKTQKFNCSAGYGLMSGETIKIPCEWTEIEYFDLTLYKYLSYIGKEYVIGEKNNKTYLLNIKDGKTVAEFNTSYIDKESDTTFIEYKDSSTKKSVVYNLVTGKSLNLDDKEIPNKYSNYITIKKGEKLNYYNMNLELIYTEE